MAHRMADFIRTTRQNKYLCIDGIREVVMNLDEPEDVALEVHAIRRHRRPEAVRVAEQYRLAARAEQLQQERQFREEAELRNRLNELIEPRLNLERQQLQSLQDALGVAREEGERIRHQAEGNAERERQDRLRIENELRLAREDSERIRRQGEENVQREHQERLRIENELEMARGEGDRIRRQGEENAQRERLDRLRIENELRLSREESERIRCQGEENAERQRQERLRIENELQLSREESERIRCQGEENAERERQERLRIENELRLTQEEELRMLRDRVEGLQAIAVINTADAGQQLENWQLSDLGDDDIEITGRYHAVKQEFPTRRTVRNVLEEAKNLSENDREEGELTSSAIVTIGLQSTVAGNSIPGPIGHIHDISSIDRPSKNLSENDREEGELTSSTSVTIGLQSTVAGNGIPVPRGHIHDISSIDRPSKAEKKKQNVSHCSLVSTASIEFSDNSNTERKNAPGDRDEY